MTVLDLGFGNLEISESLPARCVHPAFRRIQWLTLTGTGTGVGLVDPTEAGSAYQASDRHCSRHEGYRVCCCRAEWWPSQRKRGRRIEGITRSAVPIGLTSPTTRLDDCPDSCPIPPFDTAGILVAVLILGILASPNAPKVSGAQF